MLAGDVVALDDTVRSWKWYGSGTFTQNSSALYWADQRVLGLLFLLGSSHGGNRAAREAPGVRSACIRVAASPIARRGRRRAPGHAPVALIYASHVSVAIASGCWAWTTRRAREGRGVLVAHLETAFLFRVDDDRYGVSRGKNPVAKDLLPAILDHLYVVGSNRWGWECVAPNVHDGRASGFRSHFHHGGRTTGR